MEVVVAGAGSRGAGRTAGCAVCGCAGVVGVGVGTVAAGGGGGGGGGGVVLECLLQSMVVHCPLTKPFGIPLSVVGGAFSTTVVADDGQFAGSYCRSSA